MADNFGVKRGDDSGQMGVSASLPDRGRADFIGQLVEFGRFLESNVRPACRFDLACWPNRLWDRLEMRMAAGLDLFLPALKGKNSEVRMLQWYNSGIMLGYAGTVLAIDILPRLRYYGWPGHGDLTERIADAADALLVTHNHQDHCDRPLLEAMLSRKKPVIMHPAAGEIAGITGVADGEIFVAGQMRVKAHHACHVWRDKPEDVPLASFEIECGDGFRLLFCGDADYSRGFPAVKRSPDLLFITWRNPGPEYEDGHPRQKAKTIDAVSRVLEELAPKRLVLEHYAELDHVYRGFSASYEMAADLIARLATPTDIFFWGDAVMLGKDESGR